MPIRAYLSGKIDLACTKTRMDLFMKIGDIMDRSVDVERETATIIESLFINSGIDSIDVFQGQLVAQYRSVD